MLKKEQDLKQVQNDAASLFKNQPELTAEMRILLLDWIAQVSSDYALKRQTFHLTMQMIDAFLTRCPRAIPTYEFQKVGITCLHMAAKIEEIYPPHIKSFAESTNDSVSAEDMIQEEFEISAVLDWNFEQFQTPYLWTTWFMKRWDEYVDDSLSYLMQQFSLKFLEGHKESHKKFLTFLNFVDMIAVSEESKQYS